jgi:ferredoxin
VVGPTVSGDSIVYDAITSTADMPVGIRDIQEAGSCRLEARGDDALFGYVAASQSWKRFLNPPRVDLWKGRRGSDGIETIPPEPPPRFAFFGVRPCEIAAMEIQDAVFLPAGDGVYGPRRRRSLIVAVNCTEPGGTCFCVSMGAGPGLDWGYDVALTEVIGPGVHHFLAESGSKEGAELLGGLTGARRAEPAEIDTALRLVDDAAEHMGREMDTDGLKELLHANLLSPRWDDIATRCLTCANCTMVCPTCFCSTTEDELSLDGAVATRHGVWDSCFSLDFSYIHGGPVRSSIAARYRQWMTHKLGTWQDQFGMIGCVGCGRCITWCPVGIDITAEAAAIRRDDVRARPIAVGDPQVSANPRSSANPIHRRSPSEEGNHERSF